MGGPIASRDAAPRRVVPANLSHPYYAGIPCGSLQVSDCEAPKWHSEKDTSRLG